jgi:hypothetical protein
MLYRFLILFVFVACCFSYSVFGQSEIISYTDKPSFSSAVDDKKVLDFEGIAPNSAFRLFKNEGHLSVSGIDFRPGGGARFGPGWITIIGGMHYAGPAFETTSGAKLSWSPPNQPGNAYLDIAIPGGTTAVGLDLWALQPYTSPVEVVANASDGSSRTVTINTPARPSAGFVGFTSNAAITSLRITPAKGQTGLVIDNFTFGRAGRAATKASSGATTAEVGVTRTQPPSSQTESSAAAAKQSVSRPPSEHTSPPGESSGTIAYVRDETEIRAIAPDGTNDRRLWSHKDLHAGLGIFELAWRPDGKELAFSSAHEAVASFYLADIYTIRADGTGLRKLTNAPDITEFARYRKGSVTVTVRNAQNASTSSGTFIVYVAGADEPQQVTIPVGTAKTLVFKSVADFGSHPQPVVAMFGKRRWFIPGTDVIAGRNVIAPAFSIIGDGIDLFGAFRPVWRSDGSRVSYRSGLCVVSSVSSNPTPGEYSFDPLFGGQNPLGTCTWDWGPTPATANQIIYTENGSGGSTIYRMAEGGTHPGTKIAQYSDIDYQLLSDLRWLPDGSGLLYSNREYVFESANIFRYDFGTKKVTQVTNLKSEFARAFSISPDGHSVVFERCKTRSDDDKSCDLWIAGTDGGGMRLLVKNGFAPAWGK